eukprot:m.274938 g.274938  ORF g.274938 m.274938 type:complete len:357 (+) comp115615_c0_seq1:320-1390(+)
MINCGVDKWPGAVFGVALAVIWWNCFHQSSSASSSATVWDSSVDKFEASEEDLSSASLASIQLSSDCKDKWKQPDRLMQTLANTADRVRGSNRWGHVLDAGTGPLSLQWLVSQPVESIIGVTASDSMRERTLQRIGNVGCSLERTRVVVGDWLNINRTDALEFANVVHGGKGHLFDTVIMDYLLGSIEHFAPYGERQMLNTLIDLMAPGALLLFVGKEPVPYVSTKGIAAQKKYATLAPEVKIILETERLRDASMMLSQQRPYREFPLSWAEEALVAHGLEILAVDRFPIKHTFQRLARQWKWALSEAESVVDTNIREALILRINNVKLQAAKLVNLETGFKFGEDYTIVARKQTI